MSKTINIGAVKYPVELDSSLPRGEWHLRGKPMDEEELKRAAQALSDASRRIQDRMLNDYYLDNPSPLVSTARMTASLTRQPIRPFVPLLTVITSPYVVEKKKRSREVKRGFWKRLWGGLTELNPWPFSYIEIYELDVPALMIDRYRNLIICHPAIEQQIKRAVREGGIR